MTPGPGPFLWLSSVLGNPACLVSLGFTPPATALTSVPLLHGSTGHRSHHGYFPCQYPHRALPHPYHGLPLTPLSYQVSATAFQGPGLSLSPATAPFPQKLVDKVRSGQFVDMRDLLSDNVSLLQQLEIFGGQYSVPTLPGMLKPRLWYVTTLPLWTYCFLAYIVMKGADTQIATGHAGICLLDNQGSLETWWVWLAGL